MHRPSARDVTAPAAQREHLQTRHLRRAARRETAQLRGSRAACLKLARDAASEVRLRRWPGLPPKPLERHLNNALIVALSLELKVADAGEDVAFGVAVRRPHAELQLLCACETVPVTHDE